MSYINCPNCGQPKMIKFVVPNEKEFFYLIESPLDSYFNIPPNGLPISIFGCEKCGYIKILSNDIIKK